MTHNELSWRQRFDEMYSQITTQERPSWEGSQYITHHACIKQFISDQLAFQRQQMIEDIEEVRKKQRYTDCGTYAQGVLDDILTSLKEGETK